MATTASRYDLTGPVPTHQAAALRTLGFAVSCTVEKDMASAGREAIRWHCESAPADARDLCTGRPGKSPLARDRDARYRVCMDALAIHGRMGIWLAGCLDWYDISGLPVPSTALDAAVPHAIIPAWLREFAAACIAVGHAPRPRPSQSTGHTSPALLTTAPGGTTIMELGAAESALRHRRAMPGHILPAITITGSAPDEHPWLYAREAIAHHELVLADELRAKRNPTGLFRGAGGRTALVSESMLTGEDTALRNLELHLAGRL